MWVRVDKIEFGGRSIFGILESFVYKVYNLFVYCFIGIKVC